MHLLAAFQRRMSESVAAACLLIALILNEDKKNAWSDKTLDKTKRYDTKTYTEMMRMNYESFKLNLGFIKPCITP